MSILKILSAIDLKFTMRYSFIISMAIFLAQVDLVAESDHLFLLSGQSNMSRMDHRKVFQPSVEDAFGKDNVVIIRDSLPGQKILRWHKGWRSSSGDTPEVTGDLYERLLRRAKLAFDKHDFKSTTFIWMQGESDAENTGDVYEDSLRSVIHRLKTDLNLSHMNVIIGRISDFDNGRVPQWGMIRQAQVDIAESLDRAVWVNTDDLNDGKDHKGNRIKDDLHYSVEGYVKLAERFAEKSIELIRRYHSN